jgi:hypothetical protein
VLQTKNGLQHDSGVMNQPLSKTLENHATILSPHSTVNNFSSLYKPTNQVNRIESLKTGLLMYPTVTLEVKKLRVNFSQFLHIFALLYEPEFFVCLLECVPT